MAALLVAMSIMAIMFTVVMPVWKQTAQREKEEELVFRGKQYVHAIGLFQRKFANAYPPNIDVLVDQRFLRKKFKDPITNDDFVPIPVGQGASGPTAGWATRAARRARRGAGRRRPTPPTATAGARAAAAAGLSTAIAGQTAGGISGVTSKSKDQSIRLYNGRGHYNEWAFVYIQQQQAAGAGRRRRVRRRLVGRRQRPRSAGPAALDPDRTAVPRPVPAERTRPPIRRQRSVRRRRRHADPTVRGPADGSDLGRRRLLAGRARRPLLRP